MHILWEIQSSSQWGWTLYFKIALFTLLLLGSLNAHSEIAVIVNISNDNIITEKDVTRMYLGKKDSFGDGKKVTALEMKVSNPLTREFYYTFLNRNATQIKAYWAQMMFTGQGIPPREESSSLEIRELVSNNENFIGFIDSKDIDDSVKVLFIK